MKAIDRRLRRLEERLAPEENEEVRRLVELLRARRRRRLEVSGEPFEVRPCERLTDDQTGYLSVADILRSGRRRVAAPNERPPG
jgi:predicted RNase H-like nuclease (RuvC/YqgF family)